MFREDRLPDAAGTRKEDVVGRFAVQGEIEDRGENASGVLTVRK
ncbi:MAG: hypothetical protein ABEI96_04390 [Haloarculaceae archaeon]